jgi:hypothetical protein
MYEKYNTSNRNIVYNNNKEYREALRNIFNMDITSIKHDLEKKYPNNILDEESYDELLYDYDTMYSTLDDIYKMTEKNILFQVLYDLAAAKMLSNDRTIGQSILFSYHYFPFFHPCLCDYIEEPLQFNNTNVYYVHLKNILEGK